MDERIRWLCARATKANGAEVDEIFLELKAALREHSAFMREMAAQTLGPRPKKGSRLPKVA